MTWLGMDVDPLPDTSTCKTTRVSKAFVGEMKITRTENVRLLGKTIKAWGDNQLAVGSASGTYSFAFSNMSLARSVRRH